MKKKSLYEIIGNIGFAVHCVWFLAIFVASFFDFYDGKSFYAVFSPVFAVVLLIWCLAVCGLAFYSIKTPAFAFFTPFASFMFFAALNVPIIKDGLIHAMFAFLKPDSGAIVLNRGYEIMSNTYYIMFLELAFAVYAAVCLVIERKKRCKQ